MAATLNSLLTRLKATSDAERNFAARTAHELRTTLAGAIAQAQRLKSETGDAAAKARAAEMEAMHMRLTRLSERLMQLARARKAAGCGSTMRPICARRSVWWWTTSSGTQGAAASRLTIPERPVVPDLYPNTVDMLCAKLVKNALRHGDRTSPVEVTLAKDGVLVVANDGPDASPETLARLTDLFERPSAYPER